MRFSLFIFLIVLAAAPGPAAASPAALFVSPAGSDAADGSSAHPLRTLQRAADAATPGTTVHVRAGRYAGFNVTRSGEPGKPIIFKAQPGERLPVVHHAGELDDVIALDAVHDIVLEGMKVTGAPERWGAGIRIDDSDSVRIERMTLVRNRSFGIKAKESRRIRIVGNRIYKNETGIEISRAGDGSLIARNEIFRNDRVIVSDPEPGHDRGANAAVFHKTTGHILVTRNRIWGNRGLSHDYGYDGGAFEVYAASGLEITRNVVWDNENVMETGTDGSAPCDRNRFVGNVAYAGGSLPAGGLILRCASNMLVANNTFATIDRFAYYVTASDDRYGGSIDGLRIVNNVATSPDRIYSIGSGLPESVSIDHNLAYNPTGGSVAWVKGRDNTTRLALFSAWTGFERSGVQADPTFAAPAGHDFRLRAGSPAIDRGVPVPRLTFSFHGPAPDLGRFERE